MNHSVKIYNGTYEVERVFAGTKSDERIVQERALEGISHFKVLTDTLDVNYNKAHGAVRNGREAI